MALFPVIDSAGKSDDAAEAWNPDGLVPRVVRELKRRFPALGIVTDVALDPYTSHGQDGLIDATGYVVNDETVEALTRQALCHAKAGADFVAPSDMMDGRVGALRTALDKAGLQRTRILAYSAKYASSFYGPFRDAVGSRGSAGQRQQVHLPDGSRQFRRSAVGNLARHRRRRRHGDGQARHALSRHRVPGEGSVRHADGGLPGVSGEYAMLKAASLAGWLDERACVLEALTGIKRAGADAILTYFALDAARWLADK